MRETDSDGNLLPLSSQIKTMSSIPLLVGKLVIEKLIKDREYEQAINLFEETKPLWRDLLGEIQQAETHYFLAKLYIEAKEVEKARKEYNTASELGYKPEVDIVGGFFSCFREKQKMEYDLNPTLFRK